MLSFGSGHTGRLEKLVLDVLAVFDVSVKPTQFLVELLVLGSKQCNGVELQIGVVDESASWK